MILHGCMKKAPAISRKGFFVFYLAPRPGLEPGTYGLTDALESQSTTIRNNKYNEIQV
jgi:hypothetical protein